MKNIIVRNFGCLLVNLLLVFVLYSVCRGLFLWYNSDLYAGISFQHLMELMAAGLIFDSSAIFYSNALLIVMFLFPLHWKERAGFYRAARWVYVVTNGICLIANLMDTVYFPYTGKRTTGSVFAEFGNEGAGNMAKIFFEQFVANWPLVIVGIAMIAVLWKGHKAPFDPPLRGETNSTDNLSTLRGGAGGGLYYILGIILFAAFGYFAVGQMRGGYTHAVRPITISNANKYTKNPAESGAVLNTPFSLMRTFNKKPLVTPDYMPTEEAERLFSPLKAPLCPPLRGENEAAVDSLSTLRGGAGGGLNVVVLIMESFSKQHIGFFNIRNNENGESGDKHSFTPFLDKLLETDALSFRYSYANGRKSIEGMPSILSSIPNFVEPFFLTPASMNDLSGLARELSENKGYASAFFHGAENGSMGFEAFAKATGFQRYYGRTEYNQDPNYNGDKDYDGTWAIFDEEFLQFYADRMTEMKQPFMTAVFTATSHTPFTLPERYRGKFPKGKREIQECVAYTDNALRLFFEKAKRQPWYENTIFVITADHVSGQIDPFYQTVLGHYCVPIIFFAPGIPELRGYDSETVVQQTDIMPTLLGLLGYDKPYIAFGQDILNTPKEEKFALHWVPENEGYEFVKGSRAMLFDGKEITAVYDYRSDLMQSKDIKDKMPRAERDSLEAEMKAMIQQYMRCMNGNHLTIKTYQ